MKRLVLIISILLSLPALAAAQGKTISKTGIKNTYLLTYGLHGITVLDYEDCSTADKEYISRKLERALSGSEKLLEAKDSGDKMMIYGVVDEKSGTVSDFVLYSPSDCALVCLFGSISMEAMARIASDD